MDELPVIDLSSADVAEVGKKLYEAASTLGFFFVDGSGFTQEEVDSMFKLGEEFFARPMDEKSKYPITNNRGYSAFNQEALDVDDGKKKGDPKEIFNFGPFEQSANPDRQPLPPVFDEARPAMAEFTAKCHAVANRLLEALGTALELEPGWFASRHELERPSGSTLRILHYPAMTDVEGPADEIRAGAHTDYGAVTLLFQREGQAGLEVQSPVTKEWIRVPAPGSRAAGRSAPIVVNIADQLSFWSGGVLRSAYHRVRFPAAAQRTGKDRYSMAYFCHPADEVRLEKMPSAIIAREEGGVSWEEDGKGRNEDIRRTVVDGRVLTAGEHLARRIALSYY
ncbi:hypothetical protein BZA70DRAFT_59576 [Myxozyma melibiosi]|uniref:Fe2OG dioxygenase domain-containing protein n=1 Tax=Myxozyma melibiosi TaxID=54550 RepID=A0ABR1F1R1_9ASCO